jgi:hypothetical protein
MINNLMEGEKLSNPRLSQTAPSVDGFESVVVKDYWVRFFKVSCS